MPTFENAPINEYRVGMRIQCAGEDEWWTIVYVWPDGRCVAAGGNDARTLTANARLTLKLDPYSLYEGRACKPRHGGEQVTISVAADRYVIYAPAWRASHDRGGQILCTRAEFLADYAPAGWGPALHRGDSIDVPYEGNARRATLEHVVEGRDGPIAVCKSKTGDIFLAALSCVRRAPTGGQTIDAGKDQTEGADEAIAH